MRLTQCLILVAQITLYIVCNESETLGSIAILLSVIKSEQCHQ